MSRRVRRDSETSTDSWSLVEEDRLDDDFSLNSTDNEGAELDAEPIIEEPPTSDEEEEDTASEKSLEDSEDSDSDSELSDEASDVSEVSDVSEDEEEEEVEQEAALQESEDSDLSDAESKVALDVPENFDEESESDSEESELSELSEEEMNDEEIAEAARKLKEDEKWIEEVEENTTEDRRSIRAILVISMFVLLFPMADIFTSWMLTYRHHRFVSSKGDYSNFIFEDYSQQSYDSNDRWVEKMTEDSTTPTSNFYLLQNILKSMKQREALSEPPKESEAIRFFYNTTWDEQTTKTTKTTKTTPTTIPLSSIPPLFNVSAPCKYEKPAPICRALAPIPPAPFSPRRVPKRQLPRHQPCFVHVNQSKWTCQKNVPSVVYRENFTVMPRVYKKKGMGRTNQLVQNKQEKWTGHVCAKKASQSMRNIAKPTDQCGKWVKDFAKPRRAQHHIAFKTPLPCKVPTYKPTIPKKSNKPSISDDWHQKRSQYRAQLRSRA